MGELALLNVGTGDTKLTFDNKNPAETIRAKRIVEDMLRRGYALLIEVKKGRKTEYRRVKAFDAKTCEYIIADFDGYEAGRADERAKGNETEGASGERSSAEPGDQEASEVAGAPAKKGRRTRDVRVSASSTRGVAIAPSAGG